MKPSKSSIIVILLGLIFTIIGFTFKLNHLIGAETLFNIGSTLNVIGLAMMIFLFAKQQEAKH